MEDYFCQDRDEKLCREKVKENGQNFDQSSENLKILNQYC